MHQMHCFREPEYTFQLMSANYVIGNYGENEWFTAVWYNKWIAVPLQTMSYIFGRDANPPVSAGRLPFLRLKYGIPLVCATSRFFAALASKTFASFFFTYLTLM